MVNHPIFSREAITAYVGNQQKFDNQRKRRSNSKKYGSFATDINHHQPEAQDKCILCSHKHDLDKCEEYMEKSREERSKHVMVVINQFQCHAHNAGTSSDKRICQICKKKHSTGLHGYTPNQKAGDDNSGASDVTQKKCNIQKQLCQI